MELYDAKGLFDYDASDGLSFPKPAQLPVSFTRLKREVKTHLKSATHRKEERKRNGDPRGAEECEKEEVAMRVLRVAHLELMSSNKLEQFESLMHLFHYMESVGHMGDLNIDPVADMLRFRAAFADVMSSRAARQVQSCPCVAWVADRITVGPGIEATPCYQEIDVVAAVLLCPENEPGELFQSLVVAVPKISWEDRGASLVTQWADTAARLGLIDTKKLASVSFGEELQREGLPAEFLSKLTSSSQTNSAESSGTPAVPCLWDGAHMLDLADSAARAEQHCSWVNDTVETIRRLSNWALDLRELYESFGAELMATLKGVTELPFTALHLWTYTMSVQFSESVLGRFIRHSSGIRRAIRWWIDSEVTSASTKDKLEADLLLLTGNQIRWNWRVGRQLHTCTVIVMVFLKAWRTSA